MLLYKINYYKLFYNFIIININLNFHKNIKI